MKSENAQVTLDYITGIGIFLISVAFVFQFMYTFFIPFHSGSDEVTLAANRAGTVLVERILRADGSETMNVIECSKLESFINTKLNYSNDTNYNNGLKEGGLFSNDVIFDMNISIANLTGQGAPPCGLSGNGGGLELPENTDVGQVRRVVLVVNSSTGYNENAILSVRVW